MEQMTGKPYALKQVNLSAVRWAIKEQGTATRGEIVQETGISVTTVRTLLGEMLEQGELVEVGHDPSIGGRKAVRYALNKDRFFGVALCLGGEEARYIVVNICGEICESGTLEQGGNPEALLDFLDRLMERVEIRSVGIGVPGVVEGMSYYQKNTRGQLERHSIGELVANRYSLPVILENDLNAITLGFGLCYMEQYPREQRDTVHMAYLYFDGACVSAGFLSGGRLLRGWSNFAGELGMFPTAKDKTLDDLLYSPLSAGEYAGVVSRVIAGVCCLLNPRYVAVGGAGFRKECLPLITESFSGLLPDKMSAEILYGKDIWHDYFGGMAQLTAGQIFANVQLVRE